jgi:hypothetical protein
MLYHYTSAKLLEQIIANGKLRPSDTNGWRLLWATSAPTIDLTASYSNEPIVARFTLYSCDFEPWTDVRSRYQQKEMREHAYAMEQRVLKNGWARLQDWYVRYASLSADRWLRIDTRDQQWQPYASSTWNIGDEPETRDDDAYADYRFCCRRAEEEGED